MLDQEMDEYNTHWPYQPYSEEDHNALWGDKTMNPSMFTTEDYISGIKKNPYLVDANICKWSHPIKKALPLIETMPPMSHSKSLDSRVREDDRKGWFMCSVHPLDTLCSNSPLFCVADVNSHEYREILKWECFWDIEGILT